MAHAPSHHAATDRSHSPYPALCREFKEKLCVLLDARISASQIDVRTEGRAGLRGSVKSGKCRVRCYVEEGYVKCLPMSSDSDSQTDSTEPADEKLYSTAKFRLKEHVKHLLKMALKTKVEVKVNWSKRGSVLIQLEMPSLHAELLWQLVDSRDPELVTLGANAGERVRCCIRNARVARFDDEAGIEKCVRSLQCMVADEVSKVEAEAEGSGSSSAAVSAKALGKRKVAEAEGLGAAAVPAAAKAKLSNEDESFNTTTPTDDAAVLRAIRAASSALQLYWLDANKEPGEWKGVTLADGRVKKLELSQCLSLPSVPAEISQLKALKYLTIEGCSSLSSLPAEIGQLRALRALSIADCPSMSSLPPEIWQLGLNMLHLSACQWLTSLPSEVGQLDKLFSLSLIDCPSLSTLPAEIGQLKALTSICLIGCPSLKSLPAAIGHLKALRDLTLEDCSSLTSLPAAIGQLEVLSNIILKGCPLLTSLPGNAWVLVGVDQLTDCPLLVLPNALAVYLNTGSKQQLIEVPHIGPKTAAALIAKRESLGGFATLADLLSGKGLKAHALAALIEQALL